MATLYTLLTDTPASRLGSWARHEPQYDQIMGYSHLGHFFMRASDDGQCLVLHPFKKAAKSYGAFPSATAFEAAILKDAGFAEYVLRPDHVAALLRLLGPLGQDEIYIPQPYPFVGGTDAPDSYSKGNVWVFMDIVAQMQGMDD